MSGGGAQCEMMVHVCWNASSTCFSCQHRHLIYDPCNRVTEVWQVAGETWSTVDDFERVLTADSRPLK